MARQKGDAERKRKAAAAAKTAATKGQKQTDAKK